MSNVDLETVREIVEYLREEAGTDRNGNPDYSTGSFLDAAEFVARKYGLR